ncbi:MAG: hypothetical protein H0X01_01035, partial [Nitrospira sp.]|nr:hypothetical protein [Nitrospira sp.]
MMLEGYIDALGGTSLPKQVAMARVRETTKENYVQLYVRNGTALGKVTKIEY